MSVTRPWGRLSDSDLDFGSADSAMGHTADLALGIALARPERRVVCLNGDGSMLMTLGTLATAVGAGADELPALRGRERHLRDHRPPAHPRERPARLCGLARAAGFPRVFCFDDADAYAAAVPDLLRDARPHLRPRRVERGGEGPISRTDAEEARYLRASLADWSRTLRNALRHSERFNSCPRSGLHTFGAGCTTRPARSGERTGERR